jgi:hypothetical protein
MQISHGIETSDLTGNIFVLSPSFGVAALALQMRLAEEIKDFVAQRRIVRETLFAMFLAHFPASTSWVKARPKTSFRPAPCAG